MEFLKFLEGIRNPFFDTLFSLITRLGEETVFLVAAIFIFWCVSKREGYYILITGLVGTVINQALKLMFKIPRPWVKDPTFNAVESAKPAAEGYSFPSGHTQNSVGTFGGVARWSSRLAIRITFITVAVLVAFSRMYLGVHTPLDVGVSILVASALVFALYPMFKTEERFHKFMPYIIGVSAVLAIGGLIYAFTVPEASVDAHNLASGRKNASTLIGCMVGLIPVYILDRTKIKFETDAKWYAQIIKLAVGLAIVLGIKAGLSSPLVYVFGNEYVARAVRYFLIVLFAGTLWPMTFGFFARMNIPAFDRLFEKKSEDTKTK